MSVYTDVYGLIYYKSVESMKKVLSNLQDGAWLNDEYVWLDEGTKKIGTQPAADFHPVAPSLKIPSHLCRNYHHERVLQGIQSSYLTEVCRGTGTVRRGGKSWKIDLMEWAIIKGERPIRWDRHEQEYVYCDCPGLKDGAIVSYTENQIEHEFLNTYAAPKPREPRLSETEYQRYRECTDNIHKDISNENPQTVIGAVINRLGSSEAVLQKKLKQRRSETVTEPEHRLPPDFAAWDLPKQHCRRN